MYINKEKKLVIVTVNLQFLTKVLKNITDQSFLAASRSFTYRVLKYIIFGLVYFITEMQ